MLKMKDANKRTALRGNVILAECSSSPLALSSSLNLFYRKGIKMLETEMGELLSCYPA